MRPTTYSEVIEEVTDGLEYSTKNGNYKIIKEGGMFIWSNSDNSWPDDNGEDWWIDGNVVAEEIQRRAKELGVEED